MSAHTPQEATTQGAPARHDAPHDAGLGAGLRIGVFDSGLGGLSVLRALRQKLPLAQLLYVADSGHAPYGEKSETFIAQRCEAISAFLANQGVDAIVVACNTATALAVHHMRAKLAHLPIVGVEPGIKPAIAMSPHKRVGVLATPGTLHSKRFRLLIERFGQNAELVLQPCPGLAHAIEQGDLDSPMVRQLVEQFCAPLRQAQVDTVVLGCTHYPFVAPRLQEALGPDVVLLDTADAVARRTASLLGQEKLAAPSRHLALSTADEPGTVQAWTTGEVARLQAVTAQWLGWDMPVSPLPTSIG